MSQRTSTSSSGKPVVARRSSGKIAAIDWRNRVEPKPGCDCGQTVGNPISVTALLFHDDFSVLSGATTTSGIRLWDLRRTHKNRPDEPTCSKTFIYPRAGGRQRGYTSFCTDRYRSKLYAGCTDSVIYEYSLMSRMNNPVNQFRGADIDSFYIQIATCPVDDWLLSGSSTGESRIWDLAEKELLSLIDHFLHH